MRFKKKSIRDKAEGKRAEIQIGVDSSELDEAIKKASQLKGLLEDIDSLFGSIREKLEVLKQIG